MTMFPRPTRLPLAATCLAALIAVAGLSGAALAQATGPLDTSTLPRPPAVKQLVALPQTTIIVSADPVAVAAKAAMTLLEAQGWQRYESAHGQAMPQPNTEMATLKKGGHGLTLFVQTAPAQGNATTISYTAMPLDRDLPFPAQASAIKFSPDRFHLDAQVKQSPDALLAFYRAELPKAGWSLHSGSGAGAPMAIPPAAGLEQAFFTHDRFGALHVVARTAEGGHSTLAIRNVPKGVLPGNFVAKVEPHKAPAAPSAMPTANTNAHAEMSQKFDTMAQDLMKQAMQAPPPAPPGTLPPSIANNPMAQQALAKALNAGKQNDEPAKPAQTMAKAEIKLEREDVGGLPIPKPYSSKAQTRTPWRQEAQARVSADLASVTNFYRQELASLGWKEAGAPKITASRAEMPYTSPEGPILVTLESKGKTTEISVLLRKEAEVRKAGIMPKAGQAKILIGNVMDSESTIVFGGKSIKVGAGVGAKAPDGPSLDVPPGDHRLTIRSPGKPDETEVVTVKAGDIWGFLIGPGGGLPLQVY
ncbi:MAG: hypothetical protein O9315_17940 [Beijerinckiaceae bacterium]|nr:hypothetical protein [Brevundimonas sp.]MCZ8302122.1 hypothetical protein [Beijerinckiaceae bacterium]